MFWGFCLLLLISVVEIRADTSCLVASSVESAIHILNVDPPDIFTRDQATLRHVLEAEVGRRYSAVDDLGALSDDQLQDLASMLVKISDLDNVDAGIDWIAQSPSVLRIGFERLAILMEAGSPDRQHYLSAFVGEMRTRDVISLACEAQAWSVDGRKIGGFEDGCYDISRFPTAVADITSKYHCIQTCRSGSFKLSTYDGSICSCSSLETDLGNFIGKDVSSCSGSVVYKTGKGVPMKLRLDPGIPDNMFDPTAFGEPPVDNNDLIGLEQVYVSGSTAPYYFVAVHKKSLVLYEIDTENGAQRYKYMDHLRWDCEPDYVDEQCAKQLTIVDRGFQPPPTRSIKLDDVISYAVVPIFVTLNHTMELNDTVTSYSDSSARAGDPMTVPGGTFKHHIFLFHGDDAPDNPTTSVKITAVRLSEGKIIQLLEKPNRDINFGQFIKGTMDKYPAAVAGRQAGRQSFLFVGSHLDMRPQDGRVKVFSLQEEEVSITQDASYGRIKMVEHDNVPSHKVRDIKFVQSLFPLLIVLDSHPDLPDSSRLTVYRVSRFTSLVKLCDVVVSETVLYTDITFVRTSMDRYLLLQSETRADFIEISTKGIIAAPDTLMPFDHPFDRMDVFKFGRLADNVVLPTVSSAFDNAIVIYNFDGETVNVAEVDLSSRRYDALLCIRCHDSGLCIGSGTTSSSNYTIDMFKFLPYSKLEVDTKFEVLTEWEASQARIDKMYDDLTVKYDAQVAKKSDYLMQSGSIVTADWNIKSLNVSSLTLPAGGLDGTTVQMIQVDASTGAETPATFHGSTDVRPVLDVHLDEVESRHTAVVENTARLEAYHSQHALLTNTTDTQTMQNSAVGTLTATTGTISSLDHQLVVGEFRRAGDVNDGGIKTVDSVIDNTFMSSSPVALQGTKTFAADVDAFNLVTGSLAGQVKTVDPNTCLLKKGNQMVTVGQTFGSITAQDLSIAAGVKISDGAAVSLVSEDLEPHTFLDGHFRFETVKAAEVQSSEPTAQVDLTTENVDSIAVNDEENFIDGNLTIVVGDKLTGDSLVVQRGGLVSGHQLLDLLDNVVKIGCGDGECVDTVEAGNKTFAGTVVTAAEVTVETTLNDVPFEDYVTASDFSQDYVTIGGKKTVNDATVRDLRAPAFDGVALEKLVTTNTDQVFDPEGSFTFNKPVVFDSIPQTGKYPFARIDGVDMLKSFRSDLPAVLDSSPWIDSDNTVHEDVRLESLVVEAGAEVRMAHLVNGMEVNATLERVVLDVEDEVADVTGTKTFLSGVQLQDVTATTVLDNGGVEVDLDGFVNTKTTKTIHGDSIRFSQGVRHDNIFTLGDAKINGLSVAELHDCFVDASAAGGSEPIHVYNQVSVDTLSVPRLAVERSPDMVTCLVVPKDLSLATAAAFVDFAPQAATDKLRSELDSHMQSKYGVVISGEVADDAFAAEVMYSHLLRDDPHMPGYSAGQKRVSVQRLIHDHFGLTVSYLNRLTDAEVLAVACRPPRINNLDPAADLAYLDQENHFGTRSSRLQQVMSGGLAATTVTVENDVLMNQGHTVFDADISEVNAERVSLSEPNTNITGDFTFSSIELQAGGSYSGHLEIETTDGFVSSNVFSKKFLDKTTTEEQVFTSSGITLTDFETDSLTTSSSLQVKGRPIDLVSIDSDSYDLDSEIKLTQLTVAHDAIIAGSVSLAGTLDDVDLKNLTEDAIVLGSDLEVSSTRTVTGTNTQDLDLAGAKTFTKVVTTESMVARMSEETGRMLPNTVFMPCIQEEEQTGLLINNGDTSGDSVVQGVSSIAECRDRCREIGCYGLSYTSTTCRLFGSQDFNLDTSHSDTTSVTFKCWVQLKSLVTDKYLAVNDETGQLVISQDSDSWFFSGSNLLHKPTKRFVKMENGLLTISPEDGSLPPENFTYSAPVDFQIEVDSTEEFLVDTSSVLSLNSSAGTTWAAVMGGVQMNHVLNGEITPLVLTVSGDEVVTGKIEVMKNLVVQDSSLETDSLGSMVHSDVTSKYTWNKDTMAHQVHENFTLNGDGNMIENLNQLIEEGEPLLNEDFIPLNSTENVHLSGTTSFTNVSVASGSSVDVSSKVSGYDLVTINNTIARTDRLSEQVFTQLNVFIPIADKSCVVSADSLSSSVDMTLTDRSVQNGLDLVDLMDSVIFKNSDDPVTVLGTVSFDKMIVSGGDLTLGKTVLDGQTAAIPGDLILRTDSEIEFANRTVALINATQDLKITGQLFGNTGDDLLCVLYKDGDQDVTTALHFSGNVQTLGDLTVGSHINQAVSPESSLVFLGSNASFDGELNFNASLSVQGVTVLNSVNGRDFDNFVNSLASLSANSTVSEVWTFISDVVFNGDVGGNSDVGFINGQRSSDLAVISQLYDKVQAVKVSAQTEAYLLCEFISDVQKSYLSLQRVERFELLLDQRFGESDFTMAIFVPHISEPYLLAMDRGRNLNLFQMENHTLSAVTSIQVGEEGKSYRIDHVVNLGSSSGDSELEDFKFLVFLSTGLTADGVLMYQFDGTDGANSFSLVGTLADGSTVTPLDDDILLLSHVTNEENITFARLEHILMSDLVSCDLNCSQVDRSVLWTDQHPLQDDLEMISLTALRRSTGETILAFPFAFSGQRVVRIIAFKDIFASEEPYASMLDTDDSESFALMDIKSKTFAFSAGSSLVMKEVSLEDNSLRTGVTVAAEYAFKGVQLITQFGRDDSIVAIENDFLLSSFSFAGDDRLRRDISLTFQHPVASVNGRAYIISDKSRFFVTAVGGNHISVVEGVLNNPVAEMKFNCPPPEMPDPEV